MLAEKMVAMGKLMVELSGVKVVDLKVDMMVEMKGATMVA